jgi:hypothetical protein
MIAVEWSVMCAIYDNIGILTTAAKLAPTHLILLEVLFAKILDCDASDCP